MWAARRPDGREGEVIWGEGQSPRPSALQGDSPSHKSAPGSGKVLLITRQVPPPIPPCSPDLLQLIAWVFYFSL